MAPKLLILNKLQEQERRAGAMGMSKIEKILCMITRQTSILKQTVAAAIGWTLMPCLVASVYANSVTVTDTTDWTKTPNELVNVNDPLLNYSGAIYAGINTFSVTSGLTTTAYNGFCIDPFHWADAGQPVTDSLVPLTAAPKSPAELNAFTAKEIEELWGEYYSPTMNSSNAAGLQVAIWELVSSNAIASDGLPSGDAFTVVGNDYGASRDLASLATYSGSVPTLMAVTGPGQDYMLQPGTVPDGGRTFIMLALPLGVFVLGRRAILKSANPAAKFQPIPVRSDSAARRQAN